MPVALPRKNLISNRQVEKTRLSSIPRPVKQLVIDGNAHGINHASKPTVDDLLHPTPSKTHTKPKPILQHVEARSKPNPQDFMPDNKLAILELVPFSAQPSVHFGDVSLGSSCVRYVLLRNPLETQQQLFVKSIPKEDRGIVIDATEFLIAPRTEICVAIYWTPKIEGSFRESIALQDIDRRPRRIVLSGTARRPKPEPLYSRSNKNATKTIPRLFRKSPTKVNRQLLPERSKAIFSPRSVIAKSKRGSPPKPLTKLLSPSPRKRHQIVRKILSQYDEQMAIRVQSYFRMILERLFVEKMKRAIVFMQARRRAIAAQREFSTKKAAAIKIQSHWRMRLAQIRAQRMKRAVVTLQAHYRALMARREYLAKKQAIVQVQSIWRMVLQQNRVNRMKKSVVIMQAHRRGSVARRKFLADRLAAVNIQSFWRMVLAQRQLQRMKKSIVTLQAYCRTVVARREFLAKKQAAIKVQSIWRMILERRRAQLIRKSIVTMQAHRKGVIARREFLATRSVVVKLQSHWRMILVQHQAHRIKKTIVIMQAHRKGVVARRRFLAVKQAAIQVQSIWRMILERRRVQLMKKSIVTMQAHRKGVIARRKYLAIRLAVIKIQSHWRMLLEKREMQHLREALDVIQRFRQRRGYCPLCHCNDFSLSS